MANLWQMVKIFGHFWTMMIALIAYPGFKPSKSRFWFTWGHDPREWKIHKNARRKRIFLAEQRSKPLVDDLRIFNGVISFTIQYIGDYHHLLAGTPINQQLLLFSIVQYKSPLLISSHPLPSSCAFISKKTPTEDIAEHVGTPTVSHSGGSACQK